MPPELGRRSLSGRGQCSIQQPATPRTYENKRLACGILSGKVAIDPGGGDWGNRKSVFEGSVGFAANGGKLVRLEFPKTEIQVYGSTAIVYSNYVYEIEQSGKRSANSGRVTEVFVNRNGVWVNPSWHMDAGH